MIERSEVRILPFLNISFPGIFAVSKDINVGECRDLALLNPPASVSMWRKPRRTLVVGIKVRIGGNASGASGIAPMEMALEVAEHAGVLLMTHLDAPPPYRSEVMPLLRKANILTRCFRPFPNTPVATAVRVREDVLAARQRGVVFDIGHGKGSFGYGTAMAMLARNFLPGRDLVRHPCRVDR